VLTITGGVFRLQFFPDRARTPHLNTLRILLKPFFKREREREREKEKARQHIEKKERTERKLPPVLVK